MNTKMWGLYQRIKQLRWLFQCDPGDYLIETELDDLVAQYDSLDRRGRLGLRLVCSQPQIPCAPKRAINE